jgi:transcriptional regulator with XRE-family HTH domain
VDVEAGFGARLRACREAAGLSQQELADRAKLSIRAVSDMEHGRTQWPYRASLTRLAHALGLVETARAEFLAAVPRRRLARPSMAGATAWPVGGPRDDLHRGDQAPATGMQARPPLGHARAVPRQLPGAVGSFTGRDAELAALTRLLTAQPRGTASAALVISAIGGTAGIGKTALAVHWAHKVARRFPDGQLYVNLRGYDLAQPVPANEALAGFLAALGVPGPQIPADEADRAAAYRSALAGRRVLVVLDNARDTAQVRPLLPGEPGCLVVVTSRDMLAGLVARDGARRMELDVLPLDDAVGLLRALIGPRVDTEPRAAARLAGLCCCLPLALRVAAELAAARPALTLAALAGEFDRQGQLDALEAGGDPGTAVRSVFSWSCRYLSPGAARAFQLAGLHPGADFDGQAVAALTGSSTEAAARAITELARASLIHETGCSRYGMHDLLRAYAAELAAAQELEASRRKALWTHPAAQPSVTTTRP